MRHKTTAIIEGKEVNYDLCDLRKIEDDEKYNYLGKGKINCINGIKEDIDGEFHFWSFKTNPR
jgi:hypothetical protein